MRCSVRRATQDDLDFIIGELKQFSKFFGTKRQLFGSEEYARNTFAQFINHHLVFVAENETGLLGFISGLISPHMFNPEIKTLVETFWWVKESARGSRAGLILLNEFCKWGEANVDWVMFALEHHSPVDESCLSRRGFKLQERNFLKEVG